MGGQQMTKADLIDKMAEVADISKAAAGKALDGAIESITKAVKKGDKVSLVGFGTFSQSKRKARKAETQEQERRLKLRQLNSRSSQPERLSRMQ
jgi:DNA-binding protein HU-beta